MSVVGEFPGLNLNRRQVRSPYNEFDKSTIVSIYPRALDERKHTIQPGRFQLEAGSINKPSILVVGPSIWWKDTFQDEPMIEIQNYSAQIAESVIRDYCNGMLQYKKDEASPGLFWVTGAFQSAQDVIKKFPGRFERAKLIQENYWKALVKMADIMWAKTSANPLSISEEMKLAAEQLGVQEGKPWMKDIVFFTLDKCKACGASYNPEFPICKECKAINNVELAKKLGIEFAS